MKKRNAGPRDDLRIRAEARIKRRGAKRAPAPDAPHVQHELEVHQVELELQNQQLLESQRDTEASLERYTLLFDFAPIGYAILNTDGTIHEINHAGARLLHRERRGLMGEPFESFVAVPARPPLRKLLGRALQEESAQTCELQLARPRETPPEARFTATVLTLPERRILLAFEDVTGRNERERRLASTEQALRDLNRRKDEFLATLSHELRNPLAPIRNSLFVLDRAEPGGQEDRQARAVIDRQVALLTRLIDDLMDVTRIARGKVQLQRERLDLEELVRRTVDDHRASFEESGIRLESRLDRGPSWVDADAARVVQALSNVLGNAQKFTPRGGAVLVGMWRDDDHRLAVQVRDTGVGIAPEVLPHVVEPFVQAPQTIDRTRGGLGLGLATVKGLIELHGGSVTVTSEGPGRGTEVTMLFPGARAPARRASVAKERAVARGRRVLVIEDNEDNAESTELMLESLGHEVAVAHDGPTGLEVARSFHPEIVLSDIGLPDMDGYMVARSFRADPALSGAYLVAVSGYMRTEDVEEAVAAGFDKYLGKPVAPEVLEETVRDAPALGEGGRPGPSHPPAQLH